MSDGPLDRAKTVKGVAANAVLGTTGGVMYASAYHFMLKESMLASVGVGVLGTALLSVLNKGVGAGFAGGFSSIMAMGLLQRYAPQSTPGVSDYANPDAFKATNITDEDGHPVVMDVSTGKAYVHEDGGEYREASPAEYEMLKRGMKDAYDLSDNYNLSDQNLNKQYMS
jgi:hypothetical protein